MNPVVLFYSITLVMLVSTFHYQYIRRVTKRLLKLIRTCPSQRMTVFSRILHHFYLSFPFFSSFVMRWLNNDISITSWPFQWAFRYYNDIGPQHEPNKKFKKKSCALKRMACLKMPTGTKKHWKNTVAELEDYAFNIEKKEKKIRCLFFYTVYFRFQTGELIADYSHTCNPVPNSENEPIFISFALFFLRLYKNEWNIKTKFNSINEPYS